MRLRYIKEASDIVLASPYVIKDPAARRARWKSDPARPLYIEIGMGKGRFLIDMARAHPEADYIGIEVPDKFIVGYGLDYAGKYRNLPDVCVLEVDGGDK